MTLIHLPRTASPEEAIAAVKEHGYVIIDELATKDQMDQLHAELDPYIEATPFGTSDATGTLTRRTGSLIARSETARSLIAHPLILALCEACLPKIGYQLSLTEVISLSPGAKAQFVHRDELAFGKYPFNNEYEIQISSLWAMTDYTEEMGATRVVPGSHKLPPDIKFEVADTLPAVMPRGSILLYSGKLYHGGGENKSDKVRQAMNIDYAVAWVRQEENQYLSCPPEIARTLDPSLLRLMGYTTVGGFGRVLDWADPLSLLLGKPETVAQQGQGGDVYKKKASAAG